MGDVTISIEEFLTRFEYQFDEADAVAYYFFTPVLSVMILIPTVMGCYNGQNFVQGGFIFFAFFLFWDFFIMGYLLDWIEGAPLEDCNFEFEGLELSICFCELYQTFREDISDDPNSVRDRLVLQPSGTMTNLSFCVSGIVCLFIASYPLNEVNTRNRLTEFIRDIRNNGNPMSKESSNVGLAYGLIVLFIGPASMIYHASLTLWAGVIDVISILIWVSFSISYSFTQIVFHNTEKDRDRWNLGTTRIMSIIFVILVAIAVTVYLVTLRSTELYLSYFGTFILLEVVVQYYNFKQKPLNGVKRDKVYILLAIAIFAVALAIWMPSGGLNNAICPSYWPHGVWHVLAGLATFFVYLYFCSEVDLTEVQQGRVRARSFRTIKLQDEKFGTNHLYSRRGRGHERDQLIQRAPKPELASTEALGALDNRDISSDTGGTKVVYDLTDSAIITPLPHTKSWSKKKFEDAQEKSGHLEEKNVSEDVGEDREEGGDDRAVTQSLL